MLSRFPWFTKFPDRKLEWWISLHTFGFGLWLAMPGASFSGSRGFGGVNSIMSEGWLSITFLVIGAVHAQSLHINGRAAWTPFCRLASVFFNGLVFFNLAFGFWLYAPLSSGVYTYNSFALGACGMALVSAARDCGREIAIKRGRQNAQQ